MIGPALERLFVAPVAICAASPDMWDGGGLLPAEQALLSKAAPRRRREFAAGRSAAREALTSLGIAPGAILAGRDRAPIWPAGVVGSISHCEGLCCAVAGHAANVRALGLDVEPVGALSPDILGLICLPEEAEAVGGDRSGKLIFCAKEAFYKAYYPMAKTFLDFLDVRVWLGQDATHADQGAFAVSLVSEDKPLLAPADQFIGRWAIEDGFVFAGVTLCVERG